MPSSSLSVRWGAFALVLCAATALAMKAAEPGPAAEAAVRPAASVSSTELRYPANAPQLASIQVMKVKRSTELDGVALNGRVAYDENATVRLSSPVEGRIVSLRGNLGDRVNRQAVLAEIDSQDVATAQSDNDKARADERRKRATRDRIAQLIETQTVARKDLELAEAELQAAVAESARASQRLSRWGIAPQIASASDPARYGRFLLRTPISGVIVDRQANNGMEVRADPASALYTVADPSRLWVIVDVPDRELAKVRPRQAVHIRSDAWPDDVFDGIVEVIAPSVDPSSRRVQARCSVRNRALKLKAEMYVRAVMVGDRGDAGIEVPNAAVVLEGSDEWVIVRTAPGVFTRRRVKLGSGGSGTSTVIDGLKEGEEVVTYGALLLLGEFPPHAH